MTNLANQSQDEAKNHETQLIHDSIMIELLVRTLNQEIYTLHTGKSQRNGLRYSFCQQKTWRKLAFRIQSKISV